MCTSVYDRRCRHCDSPRVAVEPRRPGDVVREADAAGCVWPSSSGWRRAGRPRRADGAAAASPRLSEWHCPRCRVLNFSRRMRCVRCELPRPGDEGSAGAERRDEGCDGGEEESWGSSSSSSSRGGGGLVNNWVCESCQAKNFRTRRSCWQCGAANTERGAAASHAGWGGGGREEGHSAAEINDHRVGQESANSLGWNIEHEGFQGGIEAKPVGAAAMESSAKVWQREGRDRWTCARCYETNLPSRTECVRCGVTKTTIVAPRRTAIRKPVKL